MATTPVAVPTAVGVLALPLSFEILPSAARTTTPDTKEFTVEGATGLMVIVNPTAHTATPAVTVTIKGVLADGTEYTLLTSAAVTDADTAPRVLQIHPALTESTNVKVSSLLPARIRVTCTHGDADSLTYSVEGVLTP